MILYTTYCLSCINPKAWKELQHFAMVNGLKVEERRTALSKEWQEEAARYDVEQPFIVNGDVALNFSEDWSRLVLKDTPKMSEQKDDKPVKKAKKSKK